MKNFENNIEDQNKEIQQFSEIIERFDRVIIEKHQMYLFQVKEIKEFVNENTVTKDVIDDAINNMQKFMNNIDRVLL